MTAIVTYDPRNVETSERALREPLTPASDFYVRSHFPAPEIDAHAWRLALDGGLEAASGLGEITLATLRAHPARKDLVVALECAGNGRSRFRPLPSGVPWGEGAVACTRFAGVPLRALLRKPLPEGARDLVFTGADAGEPSGAGHQPFARSLPLDVALHPDTLVCDEMDGAPLALDHGAPARLLVPGWYGMASVKWLVSVRATREPFEGYFQKSDYHYERDGGAREPCARILVKSLLHAPRAALRVGERVTLSGFAWSGEALVERVDVSPDGGRSWIHAHLEPAAGPYAWRAFHAAWTPAKPGVHLLLSRARDAAGHEQPWVVPHNARGYGQNAMLPVRVLVEP